MERYLKFTINAKPLFVLSPVVMRRANIWFLKVGVQYSRRLSYQCYRQWPKICVVASFVIGSQNMVLLTILVIIFISMPEALCWRVSRTKLWNLEEEILVSALWGGSDSDTLPRVSMRLFCSKMYKRGAYTKKNYWNSYLFALKGLFQ